MIIQCVSSESTDRYPAVTVLYCRGAMHEYDIRCSSRIIANAIVVEPEISARLTTTIRHAHEGITSNLCPRRMSGSSCHRHINASVFQFFQEILSDKIEIKSICIVSLPILSTCLLSKVGFRISVP